MEQDLQEKAKLIEIKPILNSSNIAGIGYDEQNRLLKVVFRNKTNYSTYVYENVEPETYNSITTSDSIGKTLSEMVIRNKSKYNYKKL